MKKFILAIVMCSLALPVQAQSPETQARTLDRMASQIQNPGGRAFMQFLAARYLVQNTSSNLVTARAQLEGYLTALDHIDLSECPKDFVSVFDEHIDATKLVLRTLRNMPADGAEAFVSMLGRAAENKSSIPSESERKEESGDVDRKYRRSYNNLMAAGNKLTGPRSAADDKQVEKILEQMKKYKKDSGD